MIKITLNMIREHKPCKSGWEKLLSSLNKTTADDEPLTFSRIAESNGISDALWCLRTLGNEYQKERILLVAAIAESVLGIFKKRYPKDKRVAECIQAIKDFADGKIDRDELIKFRCAADAADAAAADAAYAAAAYAAAYAADAAAYAAAYAADAAAYAADAYAADAAAYAAADAAYAAYAAYAKNKERQKQIKLIKKFLG